MSISNKLSPAERQTLFSFGEELINTTRDYILELWNRGNFQTELKSDSSPVTEVDINTEKMIRELISGRFPEHGIIGEEFENISSQSDFQWTIDPIDGTQNLINRIPTFGTLLGLRYQGEAILGFIDHPALGLTIKGGAGLGVFENDKQVKLNDLPKNEFSPTDLIATSALTTFLRGKSEKAFYEILKIHPHTRIYYDCYAHSLTVSGSLAATVEADLNVWDVTPIEALIREVGGVCQYLTGPPGPNRIKNLNLVFGKPRAVSILSSVLESCFS